MQFADYGTSSNFSRGQHGSSNLVAGLLYNIISQVNYRLYRDQSWTIRQEIFQNIEQVSCLSIFYKLLTLF